MNTIDMWSVHPGMKLWWAVCVGLVAVGCATPFEINGLGDDDEQVLDAEQPESETRATWGSSGSLSVGRSVFEVAGDAAPTDTSPADLPDTSSDSAGSADVLLGTDSAVGAVDMGADEGGDAGCGVSHRRALNATAYTSCTPIVYNDTLLAEQISQSQAAEPSWLWSGVSTVHCDGARPFPVSAGEPCARATATTPAGLIEAVWCAQGTLAGRFHRTSDPVNVCPYGTDPVAWW